jgi:tRNA A-37 threonylcarbamoyl transferase component Bud32/pimeloyl-ACP methyl ester carboxylesterase
MTEKILSHYKILEKLGEGGMGVVYRALDTRLERPVALKLLPRHAVDDPERKWRFVREAKAASALNHPNIVTIYDIDSAPFEDGEPVDFIAMECVEGDPLDRVLAQRRLSVEEALGYAVQISAALAAAHAAGIIHRDVKPGNVMVTPSGQVKMLDFGLAKLLEPGKAASATSSDSLAATITAAAAAPGTRQGAVLGTLAYMSPEQAQGNPVDARSDVFSLGSVLYEMLSGKRPFQTDSNLMTLAAILRDPVPPLRSVRPEVPPDVERVVARALEKDPANRYPSAAEMRDDLAACRARGSAPTAAARAPSRARRPGLVAGLSLLLLAALAALGWYLVRGASLRRAHEALARIPVLTEANQGIAAFRLAGETRRVLPEDVGRLTRPWYEISVTTEPPGAEVALREYLGAGDQWLSLGRSPTTPTRFPLGYYRFRISKDGFQTVESVARTGVGVLAFRLDPPALVPPGMVRVAGGSFQYRSSDPVQLDDFWLDKYEVTNKQFKDFVDHGGYQKKEYWKEPFVKDGKVLSREEAMAELKDSTGRPGPATWELGTYPEGRADYPVSGLSWYEAAAYAEFAGKSLPTIFHWYKAADIGVFSDILKLSNFGGQGPARVGTYQGLTRPGAYDMAGNVREWCRNETGGRRYILGGAWSDPGYMFSSSDAQLPFDRSPINGLRCAKYTSPVGGKLVAAVDQLTRDYSKETPASDETYRIYKSLYAYDKTPLNAAADSVDESSPYWRKEKVSFDAAYGHERVPAYLFLPRNAAPPYQTVVYFPSSNARMRASSEDLERFPIEFVIRSGRALLHPVYKGTYERRQEADGAGPNELRDLKIAWSKDLGRSLDYLQTRRDIDSGKLAYYGLSLGSISALPVLAVEDRFKVAVLLAGGLPFTRVPPEADPVNFAPRIRIPVLLLGGRQDFIYPVDTAQIPLFRMLGTPEKDKKHIIFEGGHAPLRIQPLIKDILDWLDRYLGPVKTQG